MQADIHEHARDAYSFARDERLAFDLALAPIDKILKSIASEYRMRLQAHASKGWPGRALSKRRLLKTYILRISLDPGYVGSGRVTWEIVDLWMYDYGELINKTIRYRSLAAFADLDARATEVITAAVVEALGRRKHDLPG